MAFAELFVWRRLALALAGGVLFWLAQRALRGRLGRSVRREAAAAAAGLLTGGVNACLSAPGPALLLTGFFAVLAAVAAVDAATQEIPDGFHPVLLALGAAACWGMPAVPLWSRAVGAACISVPMLALSLWKEGAFGGGDIKLMACCGFFLGTKLTLLAFLFAVLGGGVYGMVLLARRQAGRGDHFAFGPFLCAGMFVSVYWGEAALEWYLRLCGW